MSILIPLQNSEEYPDMKNTFTCLHADPLWQIVYFQTDMGKDLLPIFVRNRIIVLVIILFISALQRFYSLVRPRLCNNFIFCRLGEGVGDNFRCLVVEQLVVGLLVTAWECNMTDEIFPFWESSSTVNALQFCRANRLVLFVRLLIAVHIVASATSQ